MEVKSQGLLFTSVKNGGSMNEGMDSDLSKVVREQKKEQAE